ncbi:MAG: AgmX/PglI C-terminal domain-containing protein [Kofleriaceae bacterium]
MRVALALPLAMFACGGSSPPPEPPAPVVSPTPVTRQIIEDDSEPEEGVTIINARGRMDPAVVEAGIAPHKEALSACYTENLARRRWLGGQVVLWWDINKEGTVTGVHLHETEPGTSLGNWQIEKCILDVARQATFGKPIGGDADFQIPLEFTARGRVINWDDDQALRAVGGQTSTIDECVHPKKPPKKPLPKAERPVAPKGPVTITLYVGPGGKAQSVGFAGKPVIDDAWAECAVKAAMAWRLPDPKGIVAKLAIQYPR